MSRDEYPPEYDGGDHCEVCSGWIGTTRRVTRGDECKCPECPKCGATGDVQCYDKGHMDKGNRAFNLADLAAHLSANRNTQGSIAKRLFKDTRCGISFYVHPGGHQVSVAGYAEADQEGCALWDKLHCHICGGEMDYEEADIYKQDCCRCCASD